MSHSKKDNQRKAGRLARLKLLARRVDRFVRKDMWEMSTTSLPRTKKFAVSTGRISAIVVKGFTDDRCALQASALSYATLISMVPLLAFMLSAAKGLGAQAEVMQIIQEFAAHLPAKNQEVLDKVFDSVQNANFGALGTLGVIGKVEATFNSIWGVQEGRRFLRKFSDYISILVVVPFLLLAGTSINTLLSSGKFVVFLQEQLGPLYWLYERLIGLTGVFALVAAFGFLYMYMPNTRVRWLPGLTGALAGGLGWFILQRIYIEFQIGVTRLNAIYGTFAAIPFFLIWLYMSWLVVLFGGEVCFAVQHHTLYVMERVAEKATFATHRQLGMLVMAGVCDAFINGAPPWHLKEFSNKHKLPVRLLREVSRVLLDKGLLLPADGEHMRFVPARDPTRITPKDVEKAFSGNEQFDTDKLPEKIAPALARLLGRTRRTYEDALASESFRRFVASESPRDRKPQENTSESARKSSRKSS